MEMTTTSNKVKRTPEELEALAKKAESQVSHKLWLREEGGATILSVIQPPIQTTSNKRGAVK